MKEYQVRWKNFNPMDSQYGEFKECNGSSRWQSKEITESQLEGLNSMTDDSKNKYGKIDRIWDIKIFVKVSDEREITESEFKELIQETIQ